MKKIMFFALLGAGLFTANAQTSATATATATLNLNLHPVQSITINAVPVVEMDYTTKENYEDGVAVIAPDHLAVYSSGGFAVSVAVPNDQLSSTNTAVTTTVAASGITVVATEGTGGTGDGVFATAVALAAGTGTQLLSSPTGGGAKLFNVTYTGDDLDAYIGKRIGTGATTYTTQVQYSIVAN